MSERSFAPQAAEPPTRRRLLGGSATATAAGLAVMSAAGDAAAQASRTAGHRPRGLTDADIFNFALNLEFLETEYYLRGLTGHGLDDATAGRAAGEITGGHAVAFETPVLRGFFENIARNERRHVGFIQRALGPAAISRPRVDFTGGFAAVARAAGLRPDFDPFADETSFCLGSYLFEDVGVTAYKGATPFIRNRSLLKQAAGIHAVEAYHMGVVRSVLYRKGGAAREAARRISALRDRLDGPPRLDQPIEVNGRANAVPSDSGGVTFSRTPQEVLNIVYGQEGAGVMGGGFFPDGMRGRVRST